MSEKEGPVKIAVIGVGGCGCNAAKMIEEETVTNEDSVFKNSNVKIVAANTDAQVLAQLNEVNQIQLGPKLTKGQGAGGNPDCGRDAAIESQVDIYSALEGNDMVFLTTGMGGGTGTGAAPVIASAAKKNGILTVGIVTKPFSFEGKQKMKCADAGIEELRKNVDALLVVPNDILLEIAGDDDDAVDMFKKPNEILIYAVRSISELIIKTGFVNLDFSDVRSTMLDMGMAVIGFGSATGEHAPLNAVKDALNNPLLKNFTIKGTKRMLVYVNGNTKLKEFAEASTYLNDMGDEDARFKFGLFVDKNKTDVSVLIVAEAHEANVSSLKACKKEKDDSQNTIFDIEKTEPFNEDVVVELQKPVAESNGIAASASKNVSAEPPSLEVKDTKPFSFKDETVAFVPESIDIDQNDKSIPAVLRKLSKEEKEKMQVSLTEYIYK
ncbi:cell division protein FtsZ [bacterium]|nr:cell division protein FtsZ [bacterium]MBQ4438384.1 cell division protein FtsZ [bacterium]